MVQIILHFGSDCIENGTLPGCNCIVMRIGAQTRANHSATQRKAKRLSFRNGHKIGVCKNLVHGWWKRIQNHPFDEVVERRIIKFQRLQMAMVAMAKKWCRAKKWRGTRGIDRVGVRGNPKHGLPQKSDVTVEPCTLGRLFQAHKFHSQVVNR